MTLNDLRRASSLAVRTTGSLLLAKVEPTDEEAEAQRS
jgi:hypothetical protein